MANFIAFTDSAIFGTGNTAEAALTDAREWADNMNTIQTAEATPELIAEVEQNGGDCVFMELSSGVYGTEEQYDNESEEDLSI